MSRFKKQTPQAFEELLTHRRMATSLHDLLVIRELVDLKIQADKGEIHWTDASLENAYKRVNDAKKVKG